MLATVGGTGLSGIARDLKYGRDDAGRWHRCARLPFVEGSGFGRTHESFLLAWAMHGEFRTRAIGIEASVWLIMIYY